ncbi:bromodomain-containing protein 9-like [Salvia splendens]|uniref:bromodomain-containing protein 9-like n=1 Tax=Salvia splendens TaxID=180675 RepID=UPI001C28010C|nr:bromodomain-containing protein 9-like [Salvia splendens]
MSEVETAEMKRKKRMGRPLNSEIPLFSPRNPIILGSPPITYSRSHRRNPKYFNIPPRDFDDERKEKKVKLVGKLPDDKETPKIKLNQLQHQQKQKDSAHSASESEPESAKDLESKKRKINAVDRGSDSAQEKNGVKATDTQQHGPPLESGPTPTLPDKKMLLLILDRLQKKDTYDVFSEPVDIEELPDYFDVIDKPMDFGTVRKKLDRGAYKKLEELEADVFLICSNAMLYNAPDTVYYRQAHSMQEIAKRDFENLRHEGDNVQPQPKVVRRGRPPSNKSSLKTSPLDRAGADPSSGGTLTNTEDKGTGSNPYNLRKGPELFRYRPNDPYVSSYRPRNSEYHSELSGDWNNEFPATILRADMKSSKKQIVVDENRRDTYRQFGPLSSNNNSSAFTNSAGDMNQLGMVGLHEPFAYARSLARFAKDLGPVAWKVASKKLDYVLPPGTEYGPGWVADEGASSSQPPSFPNTPAVDSELSSSATYGLSAEMVEAVRRLNSQNEQGLQGNNVSPWKTPFPSVQQGGNVSPWKTPLSTVQQGNVSPWKTTFPPVQEGSDASPWKTAFPPVQQNQFYQLQTQTQPQRNGFGYDQQRSRLAMEGFQFPPQAINPMTQQTVPAFSGFLFPNQTINPMPAAFPQQEGRMWTYGTSSWPALPGQHGRSLAAPELSPRIPVGSPSSSLQIGSPQQYQKQKKPDLALQL